MSASTPVQPPVTNWAGNVTFAAARVHRPESVDELRRVVAAAGRIRALGSGHSFSRIADTTGELVRLDALPSAIEVDDGPAPTVSFPAGTTYATLAAALHEAGFALANMASLPHISVAGAVATGTHGSGRDQPGLAAAVSAIQLVGPEGDLVELSREADPETFAGSVVALGTLGVVTRLTLDVEPAYEVAQRVRTGVPLSVFSPAGDEQAGDERTGEEEVFGAAYSVSVFTDWAGGAADVWLKHRVDRPRTSWEGGRAATEPLHPVPGMPPDFCTEQLDVPGPWHERLPHFRAEFMPSAGDELQSELFLPRAAVPEAVAAVGALGTSIAPVLHISELRAIRADDLWLSPTYGRDTVAFHFTWIADVDAVLPVLRDVEEALVPLGARPHWAKLTTLRADRIVDLYERAGDFEELTRRFDPTGKFRNAFTDALFPR